MYGFFRDRFLSSVSDGWASYERGWDFFSPSICWDIVSAQMHYYFGYLNITVYQVMLLMYYDGWLLRIILYGGWWALISSVWYQDVIISQLITLIYTLLKFAESCPPNDSAGICSISLRFRTDFDHMMLDAPQTFKVSGSKVKVTAWHNASASKNAIIQARERSDSVRIIS